MAMLAIAGAAMSAVSAISQASSKSSAASYNAKIAEQNAQIAQQQGVAAAQQQADKGIQADGSLRANLAGSGIDSSQGSAVDVFANSVQNASLDTLTTKYDYQLKALGYEDQASADKAQASNAWTSGLLNMGTSALSSASSNASSFSGGSGLPSISWTNPISTSQYSLSN